MENKWCKTDQTWLVLKLEWSKWGRGCADGLTITYHHRKNRPNSDLYEDDNRNITDQHVWTALKHILVATMALTRNSSQSRCGCELSVGFYNGVQVVCSRCHDSFEMPVMTKTSLPHIKENGKLCCPWRTKPQSHFFFRVSQWQDESSSEIYT